VFVPLNDQPLSGLGVPAFRIWMPYLEHENLRLELQLVHPRVIEKAVHVCLLSVFPLHCADVRLRAACQKT
jgi:hypothetical protein